MAVKELQMAEETLSFFERWAQDNGFETFTRRFSDTRIGSRRHRCSINLLNNNVGLMIIDDEKLDFTFCVKDMERSISGNIYDPHAFAAIVEGLEEIVERIDQHRASLLDLELFLNRRGFKTKAEAKDLFDKMVTIWLDVRWGDHELGGVLLRPDCSFKVARSETAKMELSFSKQKAPEYNTMRMIYNHFCDEAWKAYRTKIIYYDSCSECHAESCPECGHYAHEPHCTHSNLHLDDDW